MLIGPAATISSTTDDGSTTRFTTISYIVRFTEAVPGFTMSDITIGGDGNCGHVPDIRTLIIRTHSDTRLT